MQVRRAKRTKFVSRLHSIGGEKRVRSIFGHAALGLLVTGCWPAIDPASAAATATERLRIPPLAMRPPTTLPAPVQFAEGENAPCGCFAQSRRTGNVACFVGQFGITNATGERRLTLLPSGSGALGQPMRVRKTTNAIELDADSRLALNTLLSDGDFVPLAPTTLVPLDSPRSVGGLTIELRRIMNGAPEDLAPDEIPTWTLEVVVRAEAGRADPIPLSTHDGTDILFVNALASVACDAAALGVRQLSPTLVLVERECRFEENDEPITSVAAWLCDSQRGRCD